MSPDFFSFPSRPPPPSSSSPAPASKAPFAYRPTMAHSVARFAASPLVVKYSMDEPRCSVRAPASRSRRASPSLDSVVQRTGSCSFLLCAGSLGHVAVPARSAGKPGFQPNCGSEVKRVHIDSAMKILDRYVLREAARTWAAVTAVLLFILLSNQFARVLGDAAKDKLPRDAVFSVIGLTALQYLTILIPFGLFLAIMLALARLYRDSEMPAMMACRMGPGSLYRPLAWLAVPLALLVGWLSLDLGPQALREVQRIDAAAERRVDLSAIEPGRFTSAGQGDAVIYAERVDRDGSLTNVFLQRRSGGALEVVLAEKGSQRSSADPGTRYIVLENGRRYEGRPGEHQFRIVEFAEHGIPYKVPAPREPDFDV